MKIRSYCASFWAPCIFFLLGMTGDASAVADPTKKEARVTRIVRDVKLLPSKAAARPAVLEEKVGEGTGVRTGDDSRSELTFVDLTITRLGANTVFTFNKSGRSIDLGSGSLLFRVPKDSGGARLNTGAVTVGISGTTLILKKRAGRNQLTVLEGGARITLNKYPSESANVRGGQMIDVPPGATKLPPVTNVDLDQIMKTDPLITDFPPLPSRDLIYASRGSQPPPPGPMFVPPIIGSLIGTGVGIPIGGHSHATGPGGTRHSGSEHTSDGTKATGTHSTGTKGRTTGDGSETAKPHSSPTPMKRKPVKSKVTGS
jgi:FecR protein